MSDGTDERERLYTLRALAYGGHSPVERMSFPLYVVALFAGIYGVTVAQGVLALVAADSTRRDAFAAWSPPAVGVLAVAALLAAYAFGRVRGPVVPDLSLVDLAVPTDIQRAAVLQPWWRAVVLTTVLAGGIVGAVAGAGLAIQDLGPPVSPVIGGGIGAGYGWLLVHVWLRGQVLGAEDAPEVRDVLHTEDALCQLRRATIRSQAALDRAVTAALYAGDAAHLRREASLGRPRARQRRLRPAGASWVLLRADLLILRRAPYAAATGLALVAVATPVVVWALGQEGVLLALGVGLVVLNAGAGALMRGLRSCADQVASPSLLGMPIARCALLHTTVGLVPIVVAWTASAVWMGGGVAPGTTALVGILLTVIGSQVLGAFRGSPPTSMILGPESGGVLALWLILPHLVPLCVGLTAGGVASQGAQPAGILLLLGVAGLVLGLWRLRVNTAPQR
ncbi:hypothetical protein [Luteipulveratus flavus]|uniref:Uncharacterized protein n=1 Tax=Luteipulveratus flavus TaxID=3031728 RepID=A0ABT6C788_9MICO|nr:hypothetical protein [Luteipulveratus sp. YIM 133296]MDF8264755.1 hypothetical protein [Luteipulveratus sp. YIM 133296]